ncbi:MAG: hemagglutinin [Actinomycetaceae bacterium]|nr:hemagglutinin [Actinomycetaceae bacterium]
MSRPQVSPRPRPRPRPRVSGPQDRVRKPPRGSRRSSGPWVFVIIAVLLGTVGYGIWVIGSAVMGFVFPSQPPDEQRIALDNEPVTPVLDVSDFTPGHLISDELFYNPGTMDAAQVQDFLEKVGKGCRPGEGGTPCLKDYREDTGTWEATSRCQGYQGAAGETAAEIVVKAALSCGINPQVLLVTLQKEQGLLTASSQNLYPRRYETAMGYACPDGGTCDPQYFGFATQVYSAAAQFQRYRMNPAGFPFRAGGTYEIQYSPDAACGADQVTIANNATAALYNYTPYQPDLLALEGVRGSCSSWGNRNFFGYFKAWFGHPTAG